MSTSAANSSRKHLAVASARRIFPSSPLAGNLLAYFLSSDLYSFRMLLAPCASSSPTKSPVKVLQVSKRRFKSRSLDRNGNIGKSAELCVTTILFDLDQP